MGMLDSDGDFLATLIQTNTAVGDGFRADELKTAEERVALRDLKLFSEERDLNEFFVRAKWFRHDEDDPLANGAECSPEAGHALQVQSRAGDGEGQRKDGGRVAKGVRGVGVVAVSRQLRKRVES
jgi:hypothetical protein